MIKAISINQIYVLLSRLKDDWGIEHKNKVYLYLLSFIRLFIYYGKNDVAILFDKNEFNNSKNQKH